jgi:hypothetical protein
MFKYPRVYDILHVYSFQQHVCSILDFNRDFKGCRYRDRMVVGYTRTRLSNVEYEPYTMSFT